MVRDRLPACALLGAILLILSGCATTRHEAPPEVAPQPPDVTAGEVLQEAEAAEALREQSVAREPEPGAVPAPGPVSDAAPEPVPLPAPLQARSAVPVAVRSQDAETDRRYRPTTSSVEEIRSQRELAPVPLDFRQRLDHAHDQIYVWMQSRVRGLDHGLAGDDKPLRPVPAAPFRLALVGEAIDRDGSVDPGIDANFDIALRLPNIEERLRIFITSGELDESARNEREAQDLSAGLRYELWRFLDFDIGVRIDKAPVAFAALKWSREIPLGKWEFYPFAKVFAETKESVGYAAAVTFDRWVGRHLFRTSTYAKWRADKQATNWSETLVYARANQLIVPDRYGSYTRASDIGRGWGLRLLASGNNARTVDTYESGIFYRRPTRTRWLYWSVEPLVRWDRKYEWNADPGIRLGVEALFWDLARPAR